MDFGPGIFSGSNYWLEVDVRTNNGGSYTPLNPLQALTPVPYAIFAANVLGGGLTAGTYTSAVTFNNAANQFAGSFTGNGADLTNVNALTLDGVGRGQFLAIEREQCCGRTVPGQHEQSARGNLGQPNPRTAFGAGHQHEFRYGVAEYDWRRAE